MHLFKYLYFPSISIEWCCVALVIICFIIIVIKRLTQKEVLSKRKGYAITILVSYIVVLLIITVFARTVRDTSQCELRIFWTYRNIAERGVSFLVWQILYNLWMLLPIGFLMPCIIVKNRNLLREMFITLGVGGTVSVSIEICQFLFKRGILETDDVIHNLVSTLIGYAIYRIIYGLKRQMSGK